VRILAAAGGDPAAAGRVSEVLESALMRSPWLRPPLPRLAQAVEDVLATL
jgi:hypothetical protein